LKHGKEKERTKQTGLTMSI